MGRAENLVSHHLRVLRALTKGIETWGGEERVDG